jgi:hypothetical protein
MDPYLEDPILWPGVHTKLISEIQTVLVQQLRPKYAVRIEERVFVSEEDDPGRTVIIPDVRIHRSRVESAGPVTPVSGEPSVEIAEPLVAVTLLEPEIHEPYLVVTDAETRSVVTLIELLSPTNKHPGATGRRAYLEKRREVMASETHFVEIDLLRAGRRMAIRGTLPRCDYLVHVSPEPMRPRGYIWPFTVRNRLPTIRVPLKPEDGHTDLDLQAVFDTAYDRAGYDYELDYRRAPVPPLEGDDVAWAEELLKAKGLR